MGYSKTEEKKLTASLDDKVGTKYDEDKPRWELLPYREVEELVKVLTYGSQKYCDNNWKKIENLKDRYIGATMRHLSAWICGQKKDPETGLSHLAHAGCCLLFLMWQELEDAEESEDFLTEEERLMD